MDALERLHRSKVWLWAPVAEKMDRHAAAISAYLAKAGRYPRRRAADPEETKIYKLIERLRAGYRQKTLPKRVADAVQALPGWLWDSDYFDGPDLTIAQIAEFYRADGRSPKYKTADPRSPESMLGRAVSNFRSAYKSGRLSPERVAALSDIPGWHWGSVRTNTRDADIAAICAFMDANKRVPVKADKGHVEYALGHAAARLRKDYQNQLLNQDQVTRLESNPYWRWVANRWDGCGPDTSISAIAKFKTERGIFPSSGSADPIERKLGEAANALRQQYKSNKLSPARVATLEAILGWRWRLR